MATIPESSPVPVEAIEQSEQQILEIAVIGSRDHREAPGLQKIEDRPGVAARPKAMLDNLQADDDWKSPIRPCKIVVRGPDLELGARTRLPSDLDAGFRRVDSAYLVSLV